MDQDAHRFDVRIAQRAADVARFLRELNAFGEFALVEVVTRRHPGEVAVLLTLRQAAEQALCAAQATLRDGKIQRFDLDAREADQYPGGGFAFTATGMDQRGPLQRTGSGCQVARTLRSGAPALQRIGIQWRASARAKPFIASCHRASA